MNIKETCVLDQCNGFFCLTKPSYKCNSKPNSNKSCFILTSESVFDFRIFHILIQYFCLRGILPFSKSYTEIESTRSTQSGAKECPLKCDIS